ncbi:MAG: LPS export ABC transporter permease LptF [Rhodospirillales bacterium]|nr:LPS export ABC transporter permease LptF [Rhodospirillales bacterium]MCW8862846.1 LPS export ABC transporter permease LptF [Rhodospirillales bacterium]MCW8952747.1 LPS export ABC transporter permease LptF [Rhodospirillales bacterium]MCW8970717.1 LPS export ABC transporter permease LptF [Rhodospirillales bacterium]MCW9002728.1 LPS export ABC transporter permease LptF [Rhodospirillales bacterium]
MNLLNRYMFGQLAVGMILVATAMTCILWLTQSLRFVEMIVNRGLNAGTFLYLTGLLLPNFLTTILPIALFAVVVFVYHKMIMDRELVVMRAAGVNQLSLAAPAIILSLIVAILSAALYFYFLPKSYEKFREFQWEIRHEHSNILLQEGVFNTISNSVTVYVRDRSREGELLGILIHDTRDRAQQATLMAERGALVQVDANPRVILFNGNRQVIDKATKKMSILYFDRYTFDLETAKAQQAERFREPRERMFFDLLNPELDPTVPARSYGKFIIEAHHRIVAPLHAVTFTLIALACLISGNFTRRGQTQRVVLAIVLMVGLQTLSLGIENLSAKRTEAIPLIYAAAVLPGVVALWIMTHGLPRLRRRGQIAPPGAEAS